MGDAPERFSEEQGAHCGLDGAVEEQRDDDDDEEGDLGGVQRLEDLRKGRARARASARARARARARTGWAGLGGII